jgi:hypothetical protein
MQNIACHGSLVFFDVFLVRFDAYFHSPTVAVPCVPIEIRYATLTLLEADITGHATNGWPPVPAFAVPITVELPHHAAQIKV